MDGDFMRAEIAEQPSIFRRIIGEGRPRIEAIAGIIRRRMPRFVLLAARGTSDNAALYAKYLVETRLGLPAGLVSPSTTTIYHAEVDMRDVLFIAMSQSGSSPDLLDALTFARDAGAHTLALTNSPKSPLADAADLEIDVGAGLERAVAATKSYTAELLNAYLLVAALTGRDDPELDSLPDRAELLLTLEPDIARIARRYWLAQQIVVTSRGYNYPTAREGALKLMETSYLSAHGFSGADLLHGPVAMIGPGFPVIAIVPNGPGGEALAPALERLGEQGADILVIGPRRMHPFGAVGLETPGDDAEVLSPMLMILPLQQFAWHFARLRGNDPDNPAGLSKVTRTR